MSAKFKSTKKKPELEATVDEWDASDEDQPGSSSASIQTEPQIQKKVYQDAWEDDENYAVNSLERSQVEGRKLWEEA